MVGRAAAKAKPGHGWWAADGVRTNGPRRLQAQRRRAIQPTHRSMLFPGQPGGHAPRERPRLFRERTGDGLVGNRPRHTDQPGARF